MAVNMMGGGDCRNGGGGIAMNGVTGFVVVRQQHTSTTPASSISRSPLISPSPSGTGTGFSQQHEHLHYRNHQHTHPCVQNQRRSVSSIQTFGLFGLGTAEIAIIVVVGVFLLGPDQVSSSLGKAVGRLRGEIPGGISDDLKKVPDDLQRAASNIASEFQKGVEEGESSARARNAKPMMSGSSDSDDTAVGDDDKP